MNGKVVIIEGMDGAGKSAISRGVAELLDALGVKHREFAFPSRSNGAIGALIRNVLEGKVMVREEAMLWLFTAEAVQTEPMIREAVKEGEIVLCDRHTAVSALVYQTAKHDYDDINAVNGIAGFTPPWRIYVVDVPAEVALVRRDKRGQEAARFYEPSALAAVELMRAAYHNVVEDLNDPNGWLAWTSETSAVRLDGTLPVAANAERIVREIVDE